MASQAQNPYITISDRILHCNDNPLTIFIDFRTLTLLHDASIKVTAPGKFDRYTDRRGSIALDTPLLHYTRKEILTARLHRYTNRTDNDRFHSWRIDLYRGHHRAPNRGHTDDHILELKIPRDAEEVAAEVEYRDGDTAATETRRVFPLRSRNLRFFTPRDRFLGYDVRASFEDPAVEVAGAHRSFFEYDVHSAATTIRLDFGPGCDFRLMKTSKRDEFVGRAPRGTRLDWVMVVVSCLDYGGGAGGVLVLIVVLDRLRRWC